MEKLAMHGGGAASGRLLGYGRQTIDEDDVADVLRSDFLTCGPATERFERAVAEAAGARYATAVANGTAALHVACLAAGIGPGDEVVVSPITFAASANCVLYCGGTPVFADIDSRTWNVSPESIRERINEKTKAVIAVDFGGVHVDSDEIRKIRPPVHRGCRALHRHRPWRKTRRIDRRHDHLQLPPGEDGHRRGGRGGRDERPGARPARRPVREARHNPRPVAHGPCRRRRLVLRADRARLQLPDQRHRGGPRRLPAEAPSRVLAPTTAADGVLDREFAAIPEVASQLDPAPEDTTRHLYVLRFDLEALGVSRRFVFDALRAENIGVNVHYLPVYRLPYYAGLGYDPECCPEANRYYEEAVTLPLHCGLSDEDARCVVEAVRKVVGWCRAEKGRSV